MLVSARPFAAISVSVSSSAGAAGAGSVTTSASAQRPPHRTLLTNALLEVGLLHGEIGAVADLRRERTLEVLVVAAAELLVAGRPADGGLDGTHDLVVVQYELAQRRQVADGRMASRMAARHSSLLGRNEQGRTKTFDRA